MSGPTCTVLAQTYSLFLSPQVKIVLMGRRTAGVWNAAQADRQQEPEAEARRREHYIGAFD